MSGKREFTLRDKISLMSFRGKLTLIIIASTIVIGALTGTYLAFTKEGEEINKAEKTEIAVEAVADAQEGENVEKEIEVTPVLPEATSSNDKKHPEDAEIKKLEQEASQEKVVKYKDKEITIPKTKVAEANSAEDSQKQKTGGETISAEQAVSQFENDGQSVGIDVSAHQGKIDWATVKASGVEFAMIRCGFRGNSEGGIFQDRYFKDNVNGAVKNGIFVGIYFYSTAINEDEALQEAAWVVNTIKSYRITYPVAYDFEDFGKYRCSGVSGEQATNNAIAFLNYVKSAGYTPMMYANKSDITSRFNKGRLGYKFWLAHYTTATNYTGSYQMWQYTSNGSVNGISGRVDMNIAYFRFSAVAEPKHTHDFVNGTVINTPDSKPATCTEVGVRYIRCKDCSESQREEIPAIGHDFGEWKIKQAATTEEEGIEARVCKNCQKEETRKLDKLTSNGNTIGNTTNTLTNTTNSNTTTNTTSNTISNTNTTNTNTINNNTNTNTENTNTTNNNTTDTNTTDDNTTNDNNANNNTTGENATNTNNQDNNTSVEPSNNTTTPESSQNDSSTPDNNEE